MKLLLISLMLAALVASADNHWGVPEEEHVAVLKKDNFEDFIKNNKFAFVKFYAPWCGHCKNLKPAYEKAAQSLAGIAKVAAVNCDEEVNKPFCGQMGVQGFPTLKIVRPGKKPGRPIVDAYEGPRTAKGIVEAVKDKVPNIVKKTSDALARAGFRVSVVEQKAPAVVGIIGRR